MVHISQSLSDIFVLFLRSGQVWWWWWWWGEVIIRSAPPASMVSRLHCTAWNLSSGLWVMFKVAFPSHICQGVNIAGAQVVRSDHPFCTSPSYECAVICSFISPSPCLAFSYVYFLGFDVPSPAD
eukprot:scpid10630/ scgid9425/ 